MPLKIGLKTMNYQYDYTSKSPIIIGVVIVNYNSSTYLIKALHALSIQLYKPHQVIIFDNASVEPIHDEIYHFNLPIKLIKHPTNIGFADGNNKAIEYLDPEVNWIALLNPDAYPHKEWLLEMTNTIHCHPQYAFLASQLICEKEPHLLDGTGDIYHISGKAWRHNHHKPIEKAPKKLQPIFSPCAAAALYRRDAFTEAEGFDAHYFCYYEDIDLAFRLNLLGYNGAYVPSAISEHTGSATTKRHSDFYTYYGHRNLVWTYFKNMPLPLLLATLPLHIVLNLATLALFIKRGQTAIIFKSKKDAFKDWCRILKQRKKIQKTRTLSTYQLLKLLKKGLPW